MDDRLMDLEESHALLEREVEQLGEVVAAQQRELDELRRQIELLAGRYRDLRSGLSRAQAGEDGEDGGDPPPPHYLPR